MKFWRGLFHPILFIGLVLMLILQRLRERKL
jgi:hypothetical protein